MNFDSVLNNLLGIPKTLLSCLRYYLSPEGEKKLSEARMIGRSNEIKRVMLIGHSYNYFASMIPFRYLNSRYESQNLIKTTLNKKVCVIVEIDEFLSYLNPKQFEIGTLFIFVSKSGESVQVIEGIKKLQDFGINKERIWGVSNSSESFLANNCSLFFPTNSGEEKIIGTKAYINTILVLYLIARTLIDKEALPPNREDEIRQLIFEIKFYGQDWEEHTRNITEFLGVDFKYLYFISKGASLSTVYQGAQNCKAFARTFGEGISMGLFLHGPFQIVDDSFRCVFVAGDERNLDDVLKTIDIVTQKFGTGKVILINNSRQLSSLGRANRNVFVFEHTTENTYLAPIFEIIVLQYLFLQQAKRRGVVE